MKIKIQKTELGNLRNELKALKKVLITKEIITESEINDEIVSKK